MLSFCSLQAIFLAMAQQPQRVSFIFSGRQCALAMAMCADHNPSASTMCQLQAPFHFILLLKDYVC